MAYTATLSSTKSKSKSPFVPSPRWLSESPAYQPASAEVDYAGRPLSGHYSQEPAFSRELKSPIPPPPANLYPGTPAAFSVDPGIPFLATAGPTDAGSDNGSIRDEDFQEKKFVGGFVTGIKKVVRNSLRAASRSQRREQYQPQQEPGWDQSIYTQPPQLRDSGYGASTSQLGAPPPGPAPGVLSPILDVQSSPASSRRDTVYSPRPPSATLIGHPEGKFGRHQTPAAPPLEIIPPEFIMSPVSASLEPGSEYDAMTQATPPPSDTSLRTYIKRVKQIAKEVNSLPWVAKERVTADYYPERSRRSDEPKHHPAIAWRSDAFTQLNYHAGFRFGTPAHTEYEDSGSSIGIEHLNAPHHRGSHSAMDLDAEFDANPTPLTPRTPMGMPFTPSRDLNRVHGLPPDAPPAQMTYAQAQTPTQRTSQAPLPSGSILLQNNHIPQDTQQPMSPSQPWSAAVFNARHPPIFPVNGRTSFVYDTPNIPTPEIPSPRTPPHRPNPTSTAQPQPHYDSRPQYPAGLSQSTATPIRLTSQRPAYNYNYQDNDNYTPTPAPGHAHARRASRSGAPRTPRTPRTPAAQAAPYNANVNAHAYAAEDQSEDDWEAYPHERSGYVPAHLAEHHYGMRYGPGVHAQRPPVAPPPLSGPSSVTSLR